MSYSPERRPFRFGLIIDSRSATRAGVIELARRERWGISYIALRSPQLAVMAPAIDRLTGT